MQARPQLATDQALLLSTKLHSPRPDPLWVRRPRVLALLDERPAGCLTLIVAPAGSGKTTLARQWAAAQPSRFAWLSLDANDSEPQRFFAYLVAAVRSILPDACTTTSAVLTSTQPAPLRYLVDTLLNDLAALPEPLAFVLDDFHAITSAPLHEEIVHLITYLPETVHLVVTSRLDPPWPLGRMRANRSLIEIRAADLRFTLEETRELLVQTSTPEQLDPMVEALLRAHRGLAGRAAAGADLAAQRRRSRLVRRGVARHRPLHHGLPGRRGDRAPERAGAGVLAGLVDPGAVLRSVVRCAAG